ncbi:Uncharacterised protein [Capnocytophaga ochracea]|uniref:Uncharacterized protein n=1 Tax=Capnocytophaga ochracea TaxID=1018 RepID=A0A2X2SMY7_CAPOC|nr:Uncharacterised protein [Capnocytophaga ochracea]
MTLASIVILIVCEFEKGRAVPYTASNGTITKKDDTPENFL